MWILPKQLRTFLCAADTEALTSDSGAASQVCAQSLIRRSKLVQSNFFLREWRAGNLTRLRSGVISSPFLGGLFTAKWTSSLADIPASLSAPPESEPVKTIPGTSGLGSQMEFPNCSPDFVSLKTSKGTFRWDSPQSSAIWKSWVTERRGAYSARVKSARLTSASECSSWPTMGTTQAHISGQGSSTIEEVAKQRTFHLKHRTNKHGEIVAREGGKTHQATLASAVVGVQNWPTIRASEYKDVGPVGSKSHDHMLGKHYLCAVVTQEEHGQAAPANPSTHGSRLESWPTARSLDGQINESLETWETRQQKKAKQGINLHRPLSIAVAQEIKKQESWAAPQANNSRTPTVAETKNQNTSTQIYLQNQVGATQKQWATPQTRDNRSGGADRWDNSERSRNLNDQMAAQTTQNAKLNPRWVETLMGLPVGWTMASCASPVTIVPTSCECSATESCQRPQK